MINVTDLKNGTTFLSEGKPYRVVKYTFTKMGRGGAVVRVEARNLETGGVEEKTFSSNTRVDQISTSKRKLQYLYKDGANATFMDPNTFEQVEIPLSILGDNALYIKEGGNINVLYGGESPLDVEIPPKVTLEVTQTDPGVKGNSATNIYKPAVCENGLALRVPLFINTGDKIIVDTRTGEYVERSK